MLRHSGPQYERCTAALAALVPSLKAAIAWLNADPERLLTQASTEKEHYADSREVMNAQRPYGDMPLIVLTAGRDESSALSSLQGMAGVGTSPDLAELRKQIRLFLQDTWGSSARRLRCLVDAGTQPARTGLWPQHPNQQA